MRNILIILLYILLLFCISASPAYTEKPAEFPDIVNPDNFIISGNRLYISEDAVISIYSGKDFSLVKRFGTEGEGPKEFFINRARGWDMLQIFIDNNRLVVNSSGVKFTYHTLDGEYIKETRIRLGNGVIEPFGNHFLVTDHAFFQTCDDKIFVISGDRSVIHAFDEKGAKLFSISWFWIDPEKKIIYVGTEKRDGDKRKLLLFDFKGKLIKKIMLNSKGFKIFNNGKYYQLIENEDEEVWELHVTGLQ